MRLSICKIDIVFLCVKSIVLILHYQHRISIYYSLYALFSSSNTRNIFFNDSYIIIILFLKCVWYNHCHQIKWVWNFIRMIGLIALSHISPTLFSFSNFFLISRINIFLLNRNFLRAEYNNRNSIKNWILF